MPSAQIIKVRIKGVVQGVGYRYFAFRHAKRLNIKGYAKNLLSGEIEIMAYGEKDNVLEFISLMKRGPSYSRVDSFVIEELSEKEPIAKEFNNFRIY